jgi:myo-inositol-1(or 4)-monophosphatase
MDNNFYIEQDAAINAARIAGSILRKQFYGSYEINYRGNIDVSTSVDSFTEERIIEILNISTPEHGFLTEEHGKKESLDGYYWVVDPLDGTVNYIHHNPRFAVSIGLVYENQIILGVVYNPMIDELFTALKSKGAFLNDERIQASCTDKLNRALLNTGFPYDAWENEDNNIRQVARIIKRVMSLRCSGSCALDLCDVACGRTDGYWDIGLFPYDLAAGTLISREAGAVVTDDQGFEDNLFKSRIVAGNKLIHTRILSLLKENW